MNTLLQVLLPPNATAKALKPPTTTARSVSGQRRRHASDSASAGTTTAFTAAGPRQSGLQEHVQLGEDGKRQRKREVGGWNREILSHPGRERCAWHEGQSTCARDA